MSPRCSRARAPDAASGRCIPGRGPAGTRRRGPASERSESSARAASRSPGRRSWRRTGRPSSSACAPPARRSGTARSRTLDAWHQRFEREATRRGATVLYGRDRCGGVRAVLEICRRHGVKKAIKSKSMLSEEAGLNEALAAAGVEPVETDLGEYIMQLAERAAVAHHRAGDAQDQGRGGRPLRRAPRASRARQTSASMTREARAVLRGISYRPTWASPAATS